MKGNSRRTFVDLLLAQVTPLVASLLSTLVTAQWLGVDGRGELALVVGSSTLLASILYGSIHVGVGKIAAEDSRSNRLIDATITYAGLLGIGALAIILAIWLAMPELATGAFTHQSILLTAIGTAAQTLALIVMRSIQVLGDTRLYRNVIVGQALVFAGVGSVLAATTQSALVVIIVWISAVLGSTFICAAAAKYRAVGLSRHSFGHFRSAVVGAFPAHTASLGQQILLRGDVVLLGALATTSDVGLYSVAAPLAGLVWVIPEATSMFVMQRGFGGTPYDRFTLWRRSLVLYSVAAPPAAAAVAVGSYFVLTILMPAYSEAFTLVLLLLPGVVIHGAARITIATIATTRANRAQHVIGAVSAALSLIYIPAIASAGAIGAAAGSSVTYFLQTIVIMAIGYFIIVRPRNSGNGDPR